MIVGQLSWEAALFIAAVLLLVVPFLYNLYKAAWREVRKDFETAFASGISAYESLDRVVAIVIANLTRLHAGDADRIRVNYAFGRLLDETARLDARAALPGSLLTSEHVLVREDRRRLIGTLEHFYESYTSLVEWTRYGILSIIKDDPNEEQALRNASTEWGRRDPIFLKSIERLTELGIAMHLRARAQEPS